MKLHTESATVDLRRAQLDQFEQWPFDAGLGRGLSEGSDDIVGIRRLRLEILQFTASM
jgi:hypothetical protein